jgi:hypothetical protein
MSSDRVQAAINTVHDTVHQAVTVTLHAFLACFPSGASVLLHSTLHAVCLHQCLVMNRAVQCTRTLQTPAASRPLLVVLPALQTVRPLNRRACCHTARLLAGNHLCHLFLSHAPCRRPIFYIIYTISLANRFSVPVRHQEHHHDSCWQLQQWLLLCCYQQHIMNFEVQKPRQAACPGKLTQSARVLKK